MSNATRPHDQSRLRGAGIQEITATAMEARARFKDIVSDDVRYNDNGTVHVGLNTLDEMIGFAKPTNRAYAQLATRANIPTKHADRLLHEAGDLWSAELDRFSPKVPALYRFIEGKTVGLDATLRAVLSDRYGTYDNVDLLTTMLTALANAGLGAEQCDIMGDFSAEDGRMCLRVTVPSIQVSALEIVRDYRSNGRNGVDFPMVFAGLEISNHETGGGALKIGPRALLEVCTNGMTRDLAETFRRVHLGGKLDQGIIQWSEETRQKQLAFMASAAEDAIRTYISPEYLRGWIEEAAVAKGVKVKDATKAMSALTKQAQLSDEEANAALLLFIGGGDTSVLGLAHAVTALAKDVEDGERQSELEAQFWTIVQNAQQLTGA